MLALAVPKDTGTHGPGAQGALTGCEEGGGEAGM
jgi:hypothetical protein